MLQVRVALPSGRSVNLSVPESCKVQDLKFLAQQSFGQGFVKLVTAEGQVLTQPGKSLDALGILDGDCLTAIAQQSKLAATHEAFALWCCGGGVVTWGDAAFGGDSSSVQERLINVQQIQFTVAAFAAILANGSVVTWGDPDSGGDSSEVQAQLRTVQQIQTTDESFAAILADGSVVTWGNPDTGGDSSAVQDQLRNVQQIQSTDEAFAAILADGSVVIGAIESWVVTVPKFKASSRM